MADRYCPNCRKTMGEVNFYTYRNKEKCEVCKACLTMHVNNWKEETYLPILEQFDIPYLPREWVALRDKAYQKDPYKMTGMSVIGKYMSKMRIKPWTEYRWKDSEMLQKKEEKRARLAGKSQADAQMENIKEAYERGEITEAQYNNYKNMTAAQEVPHVLNPATSPYPTNEHPFLEVELPDVSKDLDADDRIALALKWGQLYTPMEWVSLEKLYKEFMDSFTIQGAARIDTLKQICKLSLKMNQALDSGDIDSYSKLARAYDALMKSAKFTEAQNKEDTNGAFDSVGQIVLLAESAEGGGEITRHDTSVPLDIYDEAMMKLKKYYKDLIYNDSSLAQQIENYLKRRIAADEQKEDEKKAKEQGLEQYELTDEDMKQFQEFKEQQEQDFEYEEEEE